MKATLPVQMRGGTFDKGSGMASLLIALFFLPIILNSSFQSYVQSASTGFPSLPIASWQIIIVRRARISI